MVDNKVIDKIIAPILEQQRAVSNYTLRLIAQRIKKLRKLDKKNIDYIAILADSNKDIAKLYKLFNDYIKVQAKQIERANAKIITYIYEQTKYLYAIAKKPYRNLRDREDFWIYLMLMDDDFEEEFSRLRINNSIGFIIDKEPISVIDAYYDIVDKAVETLRYNEHDYDRVTGDLLEQMTASELRYLNAKPNYSPKLDYWIENNLIYITNNINSAVQTDVIEQVNCDGIQLSAHIDSAPDHEPMQGHQFAIGEFEKLQTQRVSKDVNGNSYPAIQRPFGAWNCRHLMSAIILGAVEPEYTQAELDKMIAHNAKGYTLPNGKHLSMYDCRQYQNKCKRNIDIARNQILIANISGNKELEEKYKAKLSQYKNKYVAFSKACGLPIDSSYV